MNEEARHLTATALARSSPAAANAEARAQLRLFQVYIGYRALVSLVLLLIFLNPDTRALVGRLNPDLYVAGCLLLMFSSGMLVGRLGLRIRRTETGVFGLMLVDIAAITLITDASGGMVSGLSVLYLITVAAAAVLLNTRILATLMAALAVLALLGDTLWLINRGIAELSLLLPTGVLGSLLFATSLLVQTMSHRLESAEAKVDAAETQVAALQRLNQQIILHMQTGILLVSPSQRVTPINAAAQRLLKLEGSQRRSLADISPELASLYRDWREGSGQRPTPFKIDTDAPAMIASFARLDQGFRGESLIFIDDYTPVTQFAQSLKLNSLSKLTASIAHEIRNPLAAISHASQLLAENHGISAADMKLLGIVLNNSARVNEIIESVLEVSRRQAPRQQSLSLNEWAVAFLDDYRHQRTDAVQIQLLGNARYVSVIIDPENLTRILTNLLDNALRHSLDDAGIAKARVVISVEPESEQCHIDVVDYGKGVSDDLLPRLFEPFFTTSPRGSGLGLYLCKELCEINGAGLVYRPTAAGESAFRVSIRMEDTTS